MSRVFFDENLPRPLRKDLRDFDIRTAGEMGWAGVKNGALLKLAATEFDVFVTGDRNLPHQQNVRDLPIGIVILAVGSIKLKDLQPYVPALRAAITTVQPGQILYITPE